MLSAKDQINNILAEAPSAEIFLMKSSLIVGTSVTSLSGSSRAVLPKSWLLSILDFAVKMFSMRSWTVRTLLIQSPDRWDTLEWTKPISRCWKNLEELSRDYDLFKSLCEDPAVLNDFLDRPLVTNAIIGSNAFPKAAVFFQHLASKSFKLAKAALEEQKMLLFLLAFAAAFDEVDQSERRPKSLGCSRAARSTLLLSQKL